MNNKDEGLRTLRAGIFKSLLRLILGSSGGRASGRIALSMGQGGESTACVPLGRLRSAPPSSSFLFCYLVILFLLCSWSQMTAVEIKRESVYAVREESPTQRRCLSKSQESWVAL